MITPRIPSSRSVSLTGLPGTFVVFNTLHAQISGNVVPSDETLELVYREIAQAIRDSQPKGPVVLFCSPNASLGIGYYGRFQTLGTLYWENHAGLKAAAELNSAPTEEAAYIQPSWAWANATPCPAARRSHFSAIALSFWTPFPSAYNRPRLFWAAVTCVCDDRTSSCAV